MAFEAIVLFGQCLCGIGVNCGVSGGCASQRKHGNTQREDFGEVFHGLLPVVSETVQTCVCSSKLCEWGQSKGNSCNVLHLIYINQ
jgi:hypothetical protein